MSLKVEQFMCRSDNFGVILHDTESGETAIVDAPEENAIRAVLERTGWSPTLLLVTHHHPDHVAANLALKERYGLTIVGPRAEAAKIPGLDRSVSEGDTIEFAGRTVEVIETPGHTSGHVSYHIPQEKLAFAGDTLFALGCGRLFEEGPAVMLRSMKKLAALPPETVVYCGHEYTLSNARFAVTVEPDNEELKARAGRIEAIREEGKATLPTTIADELATNPFLRWNAAGVRATLGMQDASEEEVFAEIRRRKDNF
ncbi:hydroxyacylglutathione hydrolase [Chelativorans sp. ZYF759]|uniref:hydroxyacylglutathione hydrolase n=1 Tax=Chelativorans sp. ZYF759 TaxID=2692213 RepID=UPI00145DF000|nr:hydroxyacylglutathione hydrolase [Chelativorans sp. ZYF759]NMG38065.1 hydroxyacylglutathione hydrolase [Chelativorans sp. ZYF759]